MLPEWMTTSEEYVAAPGGNAFIVKSLKALGGVMARIRVQRGHEKGRALPAIAKLLVVFCGILLVSITQNRLVIAAYAAVILLYLCLWPARDIANILRAPLAAAGFCALVLVPAVILDPSLIANELFLVLKVFLSVLTLNMFNHTTQWNHITKALRQVHIPGLFVFIIDITLKYLALLGNVIGDLLTSLQLRSGGKANKRYASLGGVLGVTFIRGAEMNKSMYEAMQCRGFTDDYKGL